MTNHELLEQQDIDVWDLNEKEPLLLHNINKAMNALRKELIDEYHMDAVSSIEYRSEFITRLLKILEEESNVIRTDLSTLKKNVIDQLQLNP